jgi:hypothetical protein
MANSLPIGQTATSLFEQSNYTPLQVYHLVTQTNRAFGLKPSAISVLMRKIAEQAGSQSGIMPTGQIVGGRIWKQSIIGNQYPFAVSASQPVLTNGNTTASVLLSDPTFKQLSEGSLLVDSVTGTSATIASISEGAMTLTFSANPLSSSTKTFDSNDFIKGNQIIYVGYSGGTRTYKAKQGGFQTPFYRDHQIGNFSTDAFIYKEDAGQETYFTYNDEWYYVAKAEMIAFQEMEASMNNYYLRDLPPIGGENPKPASYIWQIKNGGGIVEPNPGGFDLNAIQSIEKRLMKSGAIENSTIMIVGGIDYRENLSNVFTPFIQTAGVNNILESYKGLEVSMFQTRLGNKIEFFYDQQFDNMNQSGAFRGNSAMWIPSQGSVSEDGKVLPPITEIYYGEMGLKTTQIDGKVGRNGKSVAKGNNDQPFCQVTGEINQSKILINPEKYVWHSSY